MDLPVDAPIEANVAKPHDITLSLLYLNGVSVTFDGFRAINNLSLELAPGEMRAIIGPNGAGKTTMMDIITGKTRPDVGDVLFDKGSVDLTTKDEAAIAQLGIGRKFQKPTVFDNHTVEDNVLLAPYWLFALGALFVFVTIFLPKGILGLLPQRAARSEVNGAPAAGRAAQPAE